MILLFSDCFHNLNFVLNIKIEDNRGVAIKKLVNFRFNGHQTWKWILQIESIILFIVLATFFFLHKNRLYLCIYVIHLLIHLILLFTSYRGSLPYAHFGTWKKPCYMKFVLVGLYCGKFSSWQQNLIKTFQIEGMIALITKMTLIFSSELLNGQK